MNITRIGSHGAGSKLAMTCITSALERQGRAVLVCGSDSTTAGILQMCRSPRPYAIMLNDFDPNLVDLDALSSDPRLQNIQCFVEQLVVPAPDPDDALDDVLPLASGMGITLAMCAESNGIIGAGIALLELVIAADSEGGEAD